MLASRPCFAWNASSASRSTSATPSAYVAQNMPSPASRDSNSLILPPVGVCMPVSTHSTVTPPGHCAARV